VKIKNWKQFQHYKKRRPPWIKLHRELLDDNDFQCLPVASRALAPCIWLLASEYQDGEVPYDLPKLSWRLRQSVEEIFQGLQPLISQGFIELSDSEVELASNVLADCTQDTLPETEKRQRRENIEDKSQKFQKPTLEEVSSYCQERHNRVTPVAFIDFYTANGWRVGKNAMKDWRAAVRNWERTNFSTQGASTPLALPNGYIPESQRRRQELADRKAQGL
jgi:hypothetical protein